MNIRLQLLLERYLSNNCTPSETEELMQLMLIQENEPEIKSLIERYIEKLPGEPEAKEYRLSAVRSQKIYDEILTYQKDVSTILEMQPRQSSYKKWMWSAAAIVVMAIGIYSYLQPGNNIPDVKVTQTEITKDINPPTGSHATILLANGQHIILDSVNAGAIAMQGNIQIKKAGAEQIVYNGKPGGEMQYNTLTVPRGGKVINITLSDGSRIWLNSASSLRYPVAFYANERKVELTGEAYFEVAKDPGRKFIVTHNNIATEVLGTHFNINSYSDEPDVKITLLEGSVRIVKNNESKILKPGEQAKVSSDIRMADDVDLEEVMAWKNGYFQFAGAGIEDVMRQVSRWYDVEVTYEGKPKEQHFRGGIAKDVEVSSVFKMLETTGAVHFRIEGRRIVVMP